MEDSKIKCKDCTHNKPLIHPLVREYHGKAIDFYYNKPSILENIKLYAATFGLGAMLGLQSLYHQRKAVHYPTGICGTGVMHITPNAQKFFKFEGLTHSRLMSAQSGPSTRKWPFFLRHTHNMFHEHSLHKGPKSLSISTPFMDFTMLSGEACPFWDFYSFLDFLQFQKSRSSDLLATQPCLWNGALCLAPCYSYMDCNYYSMVTYDYENRWLIRFRVLPNSQVIQSREFSSPTGQSFRELCFSDYYKATDADLPADFLNQEYKKRTNRRYLLQFAKIDTKKLCPLEIQHRRNMATTWEDQEWEDFAHFDIETNNVFSDNGKSRFGTKLPPGFTFAVPQSLTDPAAIGWMRNLIYPWMSCLRP